MANALPVFCPKVSLCIDEVLDLLGYSQSDRKQKINFTTMVEVLRNLFGSSVTVYCFGSTSEGSTMEVLKSDYDALFQNNVYNAVNDVSECVQGKENLLLVQDDDIHPGYAKLQYIDVTRPHHPVPVRNCCFKDSVLDGNQRTVLPNTVMTQKLQRKEEYTNGPAITESFDGIIPSLDKVPAIRCFRWPAEEEGFFTRRRCHNWPTPEQLHHIRKYGCFLVPTGHPFSSEEHLEWRLCFTIGERDLVRSLNDTMMKVLLLIKIIKMDFIKPVVGDSFSSYHCKVCIFWVRERTCEEIWRRENILLCFSLCLKQLLDWAKSGYCPDFFNARNNIYDRKIYGKVRLNLVNILETMLCNTFKYLHCIHTGNIGNILSQRIIFGNLHRPIEYTSMQVFEDYYYFSFGHRNLHENIIYNIHKKGWSSIYCAIKAVSSAARNAPPIIKDAFNYALPVMYAHLTYQVASLFIADKYTMTVERNYMVLNMMSLLAVRAIECDSVPFLLKMAGFFYQLGHFDFTKKCITWVLTRFIDGVLSVPLFKTFGLSNVLNAATIRSTGIFSKNPDLKTFFRDHFALSVVYMLSEIPITPAPVRMEMFRSLLAPPELVRKYLISPDIDRAEVDSLIFMHLLLYLCHDRQERKRYKLLDIINLIDVIKMDLNKEKRATSLTLLGYCLMKESRFVEAYASFKNSWHIFPHVNACKFWMAILFQKVYNMLRLHHGIIRM